MIIYSSRFATSTTRNQWTGQRGKKRARGSRPGSNLAVLGLSWGEHEPTWAPTSAELGPVGSNLGPNLCPNWGSTWCNLGTFERSQFKPKLRYVGPNLRPSWSPMVMLGWSCAQIDPDGFQIEVMWCTCRSKSCSTRCNLGPFGNSFAPSWAQRRHNLWNIARHEVSSIRKNVEDTSENASFDDFVLGRKCPPCWAHVELNLGRSCSHMGPTCGQVALDQVGPKLEPSESKSDPKFSPCYGRPWAPHRSWSCTSEQRLVRIDRLRS